MLLNMNHIYKIEHKINVFILKLQEVPWVSESGLAGMS